MSATGRIAVSLVEQTGAYVFPKVPKDHPKGWYAYVKWATESSNDPIVVAQWFEKYPDALIGIHMGPSGMVGIDLDDKHGKNGAASLAAAGLELPETFNYATASGNGRHYITRAPHADLTIAADHDDLEGVDIRSGNGVLVYYGPELHEPPTIADAPAWALAENRAGGTADANSSATMDLWLERARGGKPSKAVKRAREAVTPTGLTQPTVKPLIAELIKLGSNGESGARDAYVAARTTYVTGYGAKAVKDWDNLAEGSVRHFGVSKALPFDDEAAAQSDRQAIDKRVSEVANSKRAADAASVPRKDRRQALKAARKTFRRWLGDEYDVDTLYIVLATAAVERLDGDPVWLLIVGGPGGGKTETGMALAGSGARVVSAIASVGSLLSATSKGERSKEATGGLLREMGSNGVLFIKDFTTILSQNANTRAEVLAAIREIYDGKWTREVGTDGGRSLDWEGRLTIIGAVTSAWDTAHAAVSAMGDRFALVRIDQSARLSAGRHALSNVGHEKEMRSALSDSATAVLELIDQSRPPRLKASEDEALLAAADLVTRARSAVERDFKGQPTEAHAPESPTRFAKQLSQVLRGAVAIGLSREKALVLALRVARDSMPPRRLQLLDDIALYPGSRTGDVVKRTQQPRSNVDRVLQELHLLGLVSVDDQPTVHGPTPGVAWFYTLADDVDLTAINSPSANPFATTTH